MQIFWLQPRLFFTEIFFNFSIASCRHVAAPIFPACRRLCLLNATQGNWRRPARLAAACLLAAPTAASTPGVWLLCSCSCFSPPFFHQQLFLIIFYCWQQRLAAQLWRLFQNPRNKKSRLFIFEQRFAATQVLTADYSVRLLEGIVQNPHVGYRMN